MVPILAALAVATAAASPTPAMSAPATAMSDDACARIETEIGRRPQGERDATRRQLDWPALCRYAADNAKVSSPPRVILIGDSITEFWKRDHPAFFSAAVLDRGISGQTSQQITLRFYQDVIALHPAAVHILAGGNDVAGNTGPTTDAMWRNDIRAMVDLARANHIRVVIGSLLPASSYWWNTALRPAGKLVELNAWLRDYAKAEGVPFIDYYAVMANREGGLQRELSDDGVHPNMRGYLVMESAAKPVLKDVRG